MGNCVNKEADILAMQNLSVTVGQENHSNHSRHSVSLGDDPISPAVPDEKNSNKQINKYMKSVEKKEKKIIKLLILGSGSSGKSTLFRQIECIHGETQQDQTNETPAPRLGSNNTNYKMHIRLNCITGLMKLLKQSAILSKEPYNKNQCIVNVEDKEIANAIKIFADIKKMFDRELKFSNSVDAAIAGETMQFLWELEGIKETFKNRHYFSLPENTDYFLDKIRVVMDESEINRYVPSLEDVLNARVQTIGIVERTYLINNLKFNMFDVGGQRSERKKWIQLFDNVHAIMFVSALNHYCSVLFEDETRNAMQESLTLFEESVNSKWFSANNVYSNNTQWILFLNKNDLFIKRLKDDKIPLQICFGDEFDGPNYSEFDDEQEFERCYEHSVHFIKEQFLSRIKDIDTRITIAIHVTVATDKSNIQTTFDCVRGGIIRRNLKCASFA